MLRYHFIKLKYLFVASREHYLYTSCQDVAWPLSCICCRQWAAMFIAGAPELAVHPAAVVKGPQPTVTPADQHALTVRPFRICTQNCS